VKVVLYTCAVALAMNAGRLSARAEHPPWSADAASDAQMADPSRDPFVRPAADASAAVPTILPAARADGLPGVSTQEIDVTGVLRVNGQGIGFVRTPANKHYVVRAGDRLRDGVVEAVLPHVVVIVLNRDDQETGARSPVRKWVPVRGEGR
jgi:hypothetical protein